jgi:hypothetical protein
MLAVNNIGRICQEGEVIDDRYRRGAQFVRNTAKNRAVDNRLVAALSQPDRQVANVEFASASVRKIGVG